MPRAHRTLVFLLPLLAGVGYYNLSFFRARARQHAAASELPASENAASAASATPAPTPTPPPENLGPRARSYEEALARLAGPTAGPRHSWNARDIFRRGSAEGLAVVSGALPRAAEAAADGSRSPVAQPPAPPRVDGLIRTPLGTYAIVDGHLTRPGTALSPREKVLGISRSGVILSTGDGTRTLPLAGEVEAPTRAGSWSAGAPAGTQR